MSSLDPQNSLSASLLDPEASTNSLSTSTSSKGYDPLLFPPDVEKAKIHGRACRPKKYSNGPKGAICECCERPVEAEPLGFGCSIEDLYQYRFCAPLFFQFAQYCLILLAILLLCFGALSMFMNATGSYEGDHSSSFGNRLSVLQVLKHNEDWDSLYVQTSLMGIGVAVLLVMRAKMRSDQKQVISECNKEINSPSEYAVRLIGLRGVELTEAEVREYILKNTEVKKKESIKKVIFVYDIHELTDLHRQRLKLKNTRVKVQEDADEIEGFERDLAFQALDKAGKIAELEKRLQIVEDSIIKIENERNKDNHRAVFHFTGTIIVIFDNQEDAKAVKRKWKMMWFSWAAIKFFGVFCCYPSYKLKGCVVKAIDIPEPSDIIWENFNYTLGWKKIQLLKTNFMVAFVTILAALVQFGISLFKHNKPPGFFLTLLSSCGSLVVVVANQALVKVIREAAAMERHLSHTKFHKSVAEKLTIAQFINSTVIPIAVNYWTHYMKDEANVSVLDGLAYDMYFIFLTNAITTPLLMFFDPGFTAKALHQTNLEEDPKYKFMTQSEANQLFEGPPFDFSSKYSAYIKTMWMTALFAPLIPVVIPISLCGLIARYCLDKFHLIRRNSAPMMMGKRFALSMLKYLELTPFWFGLGSLLLNIYAREVYDEISFGIVISLGTMLISLVHLFLPTSKISKKLRKVQKKKTKTVTYTEAQLAFSIDYDRAYPLTQAQAEEARLEAHIKTVIDFRKKTQLEIMLENLRTQRQNRKPLESNISDYVIQNTRLEDAYKGECYGCHAGKREDHFYVNNDEASSLGINVPVVQQIGMDYQFESDSLVIVESQHKIKSTSKSLFPDLDNSNGKSSGNEKIHFTSQQPQGFFGPSAGKGSNGQISNSQNEYNVL